MPTLLLHQIGAIFTLLFGIWAVVQPEKVARFLALTPYGESGVSEIRATYGGWIIGLSAYTLWSQAPEAFACLAIGWFGAATMRTISFALDGSYTKKNLSIVIAELVVGFLLFV